MVCVTMLEKAFKRTFLKLKGASLFKICFAQHAEKVKLQPKI